ncbi:MAG: hypothetical protein JNK58_12275 [Phycisphaerae bacterium]|nr:hypothetical protein [Phycisphaerae bacterium]
MKFWETLARLDRVQRGRRFKIVATALIALLAIGGFAALTVAANAPGAGERIAIRAMERAKDKSARLLVERGPAEAIGVVVDSLLIAIRPIEGKPVGGGAASESPASSGSGAMLVGAVFAGVFAGLSVLVWLGIGLSSLALFGLTWAVAWPMMLWPPTAGVGRLLMAAAPLALAFATGMSALKVVFSGPWPIAAIARNVLNEAVRMKVSLVFIVLLLLLLSYAPQSLNPDQPLRYRVQSWLQYGSGLSYVVLALLTLFLSVGTVAFEQRDKVIWQTMTKPVPPWQYLLGKWIGVMGLNLVLLGVTASGVYLFTEYLRHQPAQGEMAYHVRDDGAVTLGRPELMTEDRRLLESQVLVARVGAPVSGFFSTAWLERAVNDTLKRQASADESIKATDAERSRIRNEILGQRQKRINEEVENRIRDRTSADPTLVVTQSMRESIINEVMTTLETQYRTIPIGSAKVYLFTGLSAARAASAPPKVTLRYRINAGSNDPAQIYRIRMMVNQAVFERQVALGSSQTLLFDKELIPEDGSILLGIENSAENEREISFPPDGLEILYVAGGYEVNFLRVFMVMWIKLGFTAAVAIAAATFLSFPVACLVALTVLLAAESAGFLGESLEYYYTVSKEGIDPFAMVVRGIAVPISKAFKLYADLKPTAKLVDGRLVGWSSLLGAMAVIGMWTVAVLALGWSIFRQRELATYSGR